MQLWSDTVLWCVLDAKSACIGHEEGLETGVVTPSLDHSAVIFCRLFGSGLCSCSRTVNGYVPRLITLVAAVSQLEWPAHGWHTPTLRLVMKAEHSRLLQPLPPHSRSSWCVVEDGGGLCWPGVGGVEITTSTHSALQRASLRRTYCCNHSGVSPCRKAWRASASWAAAGNRGCRNMSCRLCIFIQRPVCALTLPFTYFACPPSEGPVRSPLSPFDLARRWDFGLVINFPSAGRIPPLPTYNALGFGTWASEFGNLLFHKEVLIIVCPLNHLILIFYPSQSTHFLLPVVICLSYHFILFTLRYFSK